jgi:hypothetical protein
MAWIRLHLAPRNVRHIPPELMTTKGRHLFDRSRERYTRYVGGIYEAGMIIKVVDHGAIGTYSGFNVYESKPPIVPFYDEHKAIRARRGFTCCVIRHTFLFRD